MGEALHGLERPVHGEEEARRLMQWTRRVRLQPAIPSRSRVLLDGEPEDELPGLPRITYGGVGKRRPRGGRWLGPARATPACNNCRGGVGGGEERRESRKLCFWEVRSAGCEL